MNAHLKAQGIKIGNGTIVDATIITAPSSTKNNDKERDPEMHLSMAERKCARWRRKSVPVGFREKGREALLVA